LILDEIAANRKWMVEMMDGMPTECLTSCSKEIESLRAELAKRTDERDEARRSVCEQEAQDCFLMPDELGKGTIVNTPQMEASRRGWDCFKDNA